MSIAQKPDFPGKKIQLTTIVFYLLCNHTRKKQLPTKISQGKICQAARFVIETLFFTWSINVSFKMLCTSLEAQFDH